jgi:hypothetical protein
MLEPTPPCETPRPKVYRPRALGVCARLALGLASFATVAGWLQSVAAPGGGSVIGGKTEYWRAHGGEYDTVFLGSSHVFRAFVPSEFERTTAQCGLATRAFNFGVQAVHLLEQRYLLGEILAANPHLTRVFFEYQWLTPQIDPANAFNPRTVYWHDAETTRLAVARARHWGAALGDGLAFVEAGSERHSVFTALERLFPADQRIAAGHLQHFLTGLCGIGLGKDALRGLLGKESGQTARYRARHGYLSLEEEERALASQGEVRNSYRARRERFLAGQEAYRAALDRLDAAEESFGDAEWVEAELTRVDDLELVAAIAREVRARGVEFVLVILPSQSANRPFEERAMEELGSLVLRYNLPERYPALYDPELRWDSGHLSAEGALHFSRLLARDYCAQRGRPRDGSVRPAEVPQ